ncbi:carnitine transporter [Physocladia obscura]|uniref:Carnitine transporter n=1 Tax=Physocladia obscura TaxID=109957 RepID=A0AAD5T0Q3_9FUNG|nr:carnitine transporter [Physocladia obscura]
MTENFLFGACGGITNVLVGHPFDLVKVRLQSPQFAYGGSLQAVAQILRADGFLGLYRGVSPVLFGAGPVMGICYMSYSTTMTAIQKLYYSPTLIPKDMPVVDTLPIQYVALSGAVAAIPTSLILGPAERIKILMQVETKSRSSPSLNPLTSIWRVIRTNGGLSKLFRGTPITTLRDFPGDAAYFGVFEGVKRLLKQSFPQSRGFVVGTEKYTFSPWQTILAGGSAGIVNWLICLPIDTIKTQVQQSGEGTTFWSVLRSQKSFTHLYRGLAPVLVKDGTYLVAYGLF